MRKILIYLAHPRLDRSEIHAQIAPMAAAHPAVTLVDLYQEYPDFYIDVRREQERLKAADVVLFQHPVYWYSTPSIMKEWQDLVLEYGFAFGSAGTALAGKAFGQVVSAGASEQDYSKKGDREFTLEEMFTPLKATAKLCHMIYLPPLALYDAGNAVQEGRIEGFKEAYNTYLDALADSSNALEDMGKRDDLISAIRNFMRV